MNSHSRPPENEPLTMVPVPLAKLPVELLSIILISTQKLLPLHERHKFPIIPLLCCRQLYHIAIKTVELWTDVVIVGPWTNVLASKYVSRAGAQLLDLTFDLKKWERQLRGMTSAHEKRLEIMAALLSRSDWTLRCRSIKLELGGLFAEAMRDGLRRYPSELFQPLKERSNHLHWLSPSRSLYTSQSERPSLGFYHRLAISLSSPSFTGLERLEMVTGLGPDRVMAEETLRNILNGNPCLQFLRLENILLGLPSNVNPKPTLPLRRLEEVILALIDVDDLLTLSIILHAPNVRRFAIRGGMLEDVSADIITRFAFPALEELALEGLLMGGEDLAGCFHPFPKMRHLLLGIGIDLWDSSGAVGPESLYQPLCKASILTFRHFYLEDVKLLAMQSAANTLRISTRDIGLTAHSSKRDFDEHEGAMLWLKERFQVDVFGSERDLAGGRIYSSWQALQEDDPITADMITDEGVWEIELPWLSKDYK